MKSSTYLFFILLLLFNYSQAQESINTSGGEANSSGGSVSFSIGQVVYSSYLSNEGSESQGVQQAFEIFTSVSGDISKSLLLAVFPNPTVEVLMLKFDEYRKENLKYQLLDMQGKLLNEANILEIQTRIDMTGLPSSTYLIKVFDLNHAEKKVFKVIKK